MRLPSLLVLLLGALTACRTAPAPRTDTSLLAAPPLTSPTLGPGDLVEIRVTQDADLTGIWGLSDQGTVDYPLCGKVTLAGHTTSSAEDLLRTCLARYLRQPTVSVIVREYTSKKVFVLGEVQRPGTFPYEQGMTIIQAITLAGGMTKVAAPNGTHVTRPGADGTLRKIRVFVKDISDGREPNVQLQPGDIVFVPESFL
jgi:protein involved in polysaccharide export with SLBB domain